MSRLLTKLRRGITRGAPQVVVTILLLGVAVSTYVGSKATQASLLRSRAAYYERSSYPQVFARMRRAPLGLVEHIRALSGVARVEPRIMAEGSLDVPGHSDPIKATFVSLPDEVHGLSRVEVRDGTAPDPARPWDVLVNDSFLAAHGLEPGARLPAVVRGRRVMVRVSGAAISPEFIFTAPAGELMPDEKRFAIVWMPPTTLAPLVDMSGAFNDVGLTLTEPGLEAQVIGELDSLVQRYGAVGAHGRDQQLSHRYLSEEIRQLGATAVLVPTIFLLVAAYLLQVFLARLIVAERQEIATLKALGYSNSALFIHYLELVLVVSIGGLLLGVAGGWWMAERMSTLYLQFYHLPRLEIEVSPRLFVEASALTFGVGLFAAGRSLGQVVRLAPAEAMRPEPPRSYARTWLEGLGLHLAFGQIGRMILRNAARRPLRTLGASFGLGLGVALVVVGAFFGDALDELLDIQFGLVERQDATINFTHPIDPAAVADLRALPGVLEVEPFHVVPVTFRSGARSHRSIVYGLDADTTLRQAVDRRGRSFSLDSGGIAVTRQLAEMLGLGPGDPIDVEVHDGRSRSFVLPIRATVDDLIGVSGYVPIGDLWRLVEEGPRISGAYLTLDPAHEAALLARLRESPVVAGVGLRRHLMEAFTSQSAEYMLVFSGVLVALASLICAGVVMNSARITFAERSRELATMRVLGFRRLEVAMVLIGEFALQVGLAIPLGCGLGLWLAYLTCEFSGSDLFRLPFAVRAGTLLLAVATLLGSASAVALSVVRRVGRIDLVEVLKARE